VRACWGAACPVLVCPWPWRPGSWLACFSPMEMLPRYVCGAYLVVVFVSFEGLAQTVYIRNIFVLFCAKISKYTGYIYTVLANPIHLTGSPAAHLWRRCPGACAMCCLPCSDMSVCLALVVCFVPRILSQGCVCVPCLI